MAGTLMNAAHTLKAFDDDLDRLRALVAQMGGSIELLLSNANDALKGREPVNAGENDALCRQINALVGEIEREGICIIALRAPLADDLREVISALKTAALLENVANSAREICDRVVNLPASSNLAPLSVLPAMAAGTRDFLTLALDAFVSRRCDLASECDERLRVLTDFQDSFFRILLTHMMGDPGTISTCLDLLGTAQNLERIGRYSAAICDVVCFATTGQRYAAQGHQGLASEERL